MGRKRMSMTEWIAEEMRTEPEEPPCAQFALVYYVSSQATELKTIRLTSASPLAPAEIASVFDRISETHAAGVSGVQQYEILSFREGSHDPTGHYPFRKNGDIDNAGLGTEGPNMQGFMSQLMRHKEAETSLMVRHTQQVFEFLIESNRILAEQNSRLMTESQDTLDLARTMILERSANQFDMTERLLKMKHNQRLKSQALTLAPAIINRLMGQEIFPQTAVDSELINQFAKSLTDTQIEGLAKLLRPEQLALLADRLERAMADKEAEEAGPTEADLVDLAKHPPGSPPPPTGPNGALS
jgi:hypothetical protein